MSAVTENVIEFLRNQETATVTFCQGRFVTKIKKLAKQYPDECEIVAENKDGSILAHIPVKWIKISRIVREMSDEQREAQSERLRNNLLNASNKSKNGSGGSEDS